MASKHLLIQENVYGDLRNYRDEKDFKSFTAAIKHLLAIEKSMRTIDIELSKNLFSTPQQEDAGKDPGSAQDINCTYESEFEFDVFPPELKKLLKKEKNEH